MVIGVPRAGVWPRDPHTQLPDSLHYGITGGLVDGPVYRSIYAGLRGIRLLHDDEFARFNTGFIVYHDDMGDYSTNEHIMDGTANLAYLLATRHRVPRSTTAVGQSPHVGVEWRGIASESFAFAT